VTGIATGPPAGPQTDSTALDAAPIAIWKEDFSEIGVYCAAKRAEGVEDMRTFLGAHLLNVATEFERLRSRMTAVDAIQALRREGGSPFRQSLIDALESDTTGIAALVARRLAIADLEAGHINNEDVLTHDGLLLLSKGQQLTGAHLQRLRTFSESTGVPEPIEVLVEEEEAFDRASVAAR